MGRQNETVRGGKGAPFKISTQHSRQEDPVLEAAITDEFLDDDPCVLEIRASQDQMSVGPIACQPGPRFDEQIRAFFEVDPAQIEKDALPSQAGKLLKKKIGARGVW